MSHPRKGTGPHKMIYSDDFFVSIEMSASSLQEYQQSLQKKKQVDQFLTKNQNRID